MAAVIYRAKSSFEMLAEYNALSFEKGDRFEILEENVEGKHWWGARALKDDAVGFVPTDYLEIDDDVTIGTDPLIEATREAHRRTLEELQRAPNFRRPDETMIPEPDYSDDEEDDGGCPVTARTRTPSNGYVSEDGLIVPRKLSNPNMDSKGKQQLHRELLFNQKMGKKVLGQKSELKKVMDKFQDEQKKKELETERLNKRTSLQMKLEERANRLKAADEPEPEVETEKDKSGNNEQCEFKRIHAKLRPAATNQSQ